MNKADGYDHRGAMFGIPPYGGSISQAVYYAPYNLCDDSTTTTTTTRIDTTNWSSPFVLLVDRGDCSFVQKVRNSQRIGASAVLIADDICICGRPNCNNNDDNNNNNNTTKSNATGGGAGTNFEDAFCESQEYV